MNRITILLSIIIILISSCKQEEKDILVFVKGGAFKNSNSSYYISGITVADFYIGKYEVTQKMWHEVMGYNPSTFIGDNLPVDMVSWYESIEYCNARSLKEGLVPYYIIQSKDVDSINISEFDDVKWIVTINALSNGYRLPTEKEWEYAASGGQKSQGYSYSGSNDINNVAWYWRNSGDNFLTGNWQWITLENNGNSTQNIGLKSKNELNLFDMSGNVREWCWDWYEDSLIEKGLYRVWKGGGWIGGEHACELSHRGKFEANGKGSDQGFRVARSIINTVDDI